MNASDRHNKLSVMLGSIAAKFMLRHGRYP